MRPALARRRQKGSRCRYNDLEQKDDDLKDIDDKSYNDAHDEVLKESDGVEPTDKKQKDKFTNRVCDLHAKNKLKYSQQTIIRLKKQLASLSSRYPASPSSTCVPPPRHTPPAPSFSTTTATTTNATTASATAVATVCAKQRGEAASSAEQEQKLANERAKVARLAKQLRYYRGLHIHDQHYMKYLPTRQQQHQQQQQQRQKLQQLVLQSSPASSVASPPLQDVGAPHHKPSFLIHTPSHANAISATPPPSTTTTGNGAFIPTTPAFSCVTPAATTPATTPLAVHPITLDHYLSNDVAPAVTDAPLARNEPMMPTVEPASPYVPVERSAVLPPSVPIHATSASASAAVSPSPSASPSGPTCEFLQPNAGTIAASISGTTTATARRTAFAGLSSVAVVVPRNAMASAAEAPGPRAAIIATTQQRQGPDLQLQIQAQLLTPAVSDRDEKSASLPTLRQHEQDQQHQNHQVGEAAIDVPSGLFPEWNFDTDASFFSHGPEIISFGAGCDVNNDAEGILRVSHDNTPQTPESRPTVGSATFAKTTTGKPLTSMDLELDSLQLACQRYKPSENPNEG